MTAKEQIIIDGVNVKDCRRRIGKDNYCRYFKRLCSDNNFNCVWKQLARKTQECEELKKQLIQKDEINTFFNTPIEGWSSNPCDICESKNNYGQLKHECEELEKKLNTSEEWRIKAENLNEKQDLENTRYRKALEEIEGIIKSSTIDFNHIDWEAKASHALTAVDKISDIINKAKGEENVK